jgi:hypothetical protein
MCAEGKNTSGAAQVPDFTTVGFDSPQAARLTALEHADLQGVAALQLKFCVSATYNSSTNQICFTVPIWGNRCITSPIHIPAGGELKACGETCGGIIPRGLQVTVYLNGNPIWSGTIVGSC